jgi:predicted methyltransferase
MKHLTLAVAAFVLVGACARETPVQAQSRSPATTSPAGFPKPDRPVADIVSPIWASVTERDGVDESGQVVRAMGIKAGMTVADIGAGSGYHTVRLSPVVGPTGRVLAQDVVDNYLEDLRADIARRRLTNVTVIKGTPDDPKLPPGSVDAALLVHMYHEIEQPYALLYNLVPSLKPGAKVGIEDLDRPTQNHGTPPALLRCELEAVGYRQTDFVTLRGGIGYLAIFEAPSLEKRPAPSAIKVCQAPRR